MVDSQKVLSNAIPVVVFILIIGLGAWLVGSVGLPFLDSPDTFEVRDVITFQETDSEVILNLENPERANEIVVLVDGTEQSWSNNTIRISKESSPTIAIETYPENQGLYDRYEYPLGQVQNNIQAPEEILVGEESTFSIQTTANSSELKNIQWRVDGELVKNGGLGVDHTFNESRTYNISVQANAKNVEYTTTKEVRVFEPGEIVLDVNVTSKDLVAYESFDLRVQELTNQSVEEVDIEWGNGENTTVGINETTKYWYTEPGNYNMTIYGESTIADANVTQEVQMNISERESEEEISHVNVNIFNQEGRPISNASVSVGSVSSETESDGGTRLTVVPGTYTVTANAPGYVEISQEILVTQEDFVMDLSLDPVEPPTDPPENVGNGLNFTDSDLDYEDNSTNGTQIPENADEVDSLILESFENLNGTGTQNDPYQISEYLELQSARVQPAAYYELTNNIDASISVQQDVVQEVTEKEVGVAGDQMFELPYLNSTPSSISVKVRGEEVDPSNYQVVNLGEDPISKGSRYVLAFAQDGQAVTAAERLDVNSNSPVTVSYELNEMKYKGFRPIDAEGNSLNIDGNGYTISGLYINRPFEDNVGLTTNIEGGVIENVRLSASIRGSDKTGGIIGVGDNIRVRNVEVGGRIFGNSEVGAVAGRANNAEIEKSYGFASISGQSRVGGLVGVLSGSQRSATVTNSYTSLGNEKTIEGEHEVGGLIGRVISSDVEESYVKGVIFGSETDASRMGGLAGYVSQDSEIKSVYTVTPIARPETDGQEFSSDVGGIVGANNGTINTGYWDNSIQQSASNPVGVQMTGGSSSLITAMSSQDMTGLDVPDSMLEFDFKDTWEPQENDYPKLQSEIEIFETTVIITDSERAEIQEPSITIVNSNGETVETVQSENSDTVTETFALPEGDYQITVDTTQFSQTKEYRVASAGSVEFVLNSDNES